MGEVSRVTAATENWRDLAAYASQSDAKSAARELESWLNSSRQSPGSENVSPGESPADPSSTSSLQDLGAERCLGMCHTGTDRGPRGEDKSDKLLNHVTGIPQSLFGALEFATGMALDSTGFGLVVGVPIAFHGADNMAAGLEKAATGKSVKTFTERGATALAEHAGVSPETAAEIGYWTDAAANVGAPAKLTYKALTHFQRVGSPQMQPLYKEPFRGESMLEKEMVRLRDPYADQHTHSPRYPKK